MRDCSASRAEGVRVFHAEAVFTINEKTKKRKSEKVKNLEAKFRLRSHDEAEARAAALGYVRRAILNQRDTFFRVANGNLKLREENGSAVLISYRQRSGESGALMLSDYEIVPVADPARMLRVLDDALGAIAVVEKVRTLMTRDNLRLHLDRVASLGRVRRDRGGDRRR